MTPTMWIATIAWALLCLGYLSRRKRERHVPLVLTGIALDVGIVLHLELTRNAMQTAMAFTLGAFEQLHIAMSSIALILYAPVLITGVMLFRSPASRARTWHIRIAVTALLFRTAGFLFMFSLFGKR